MKKALALALAVGLGFSACYGPFNLTKKLHKWNAEVGEKWVNEAVFLGFAVLQVYTLAILGDAIIFNAVEYWGGKNPVTVKRVRSIEQGEHQAVLTFTKDRLRIDSFEKGRPARTVVLQPEGGVLAARDPQGRLLMTGRSEEGKIVLADALGRTLARHDPAVLERR